MKHSRGLLTALLRLTGVAMLGGLVFVFCPFAWMQRIHTGIGMGELEYTPLMSYLTRTLSAMYAVVGATLLSPQIDVPEAAKATLTFQLFLDVDAGTTTDLLRVAVVEMNGKKTVWDKASKVPNGKTNGFAQQTVDLTAYAGTKVRLEITFDSVTSGGNLGEGAFLDDLYVTTTCAPGTGSTGTKAPTTATLWGVYAAADDLAWAVGSDGAIVRWNGTEWALENKGKSKEIYGFGGPPGGPAFGVGASGLLGELDATGLYAQTVPTNTTLRAVAVTPATKDAPAHAIVDT